MPNDQDQTPPAADFQKAQKYIDKLTGLIDQEKITPVQTDLSKFDPSSFQDHYRIDLQDYQIEISHSKQANSGEDVYMMVFTNLQKIREEHESGQTFTNKVILAYTKLSPQQFHQFKISAQKQIEIIRRREEEKRFEQALKPIDEILNNPDSHLAQTPNNESSQPMIQDQSLNQPGPALETSDNHFELKEYDVNSNT